MAHRLEQAVEIRELDAQLLEPFVRLLIVIVHCDMGSTSKEFQRGGEDSEGGSTAISYLPSS